MRPSTRAAAAAALLLAHVHGPAAARTVSCADLRAEVEAKIRANGVTSFAVEVVPAASQAQGRVVGSCERGARKLVYVKGRAAAPDAPRPRADAGTDAAAPARPRAPPVITECADGRVITSGNCGSR